MQIGRKPLNETEFNKLWLQLYKEFTNLYYKKGCDATKVYNTVFSLCTSVSSLENKLYWKIGDFLYNRCREIREGILQSKDRIEEYNNSFEKYKIFLKNINTLCAFINECISGKPINEFGFLLWEKCVIQGMGSGFFDQVYLYKEKQNDSFERRKVIESFKYIIPDPSDPLLYYIQKYEIIGIKLILEKYSNLCTIKSLLSFGDEVYKVLEFENQSFKKYFLPESSCRVEKCLETILYENRQNEILLAYKQLLHKTFIYLGGNDSEKLYKKSEMELEIGINNEKSTIVQHSKNTKEESVSNKSSLFSFDHELLKDLKFVIESQSADNWILKEWKQKQIETLPIYAQLHEQLGILNEGRVILKKAFALFILEVLQSNKEKLSGSVEKINKLWEKLEQLNFISYQSEFTFIIRHVLRKQLETVKPCFATRLAEFSKELVQNKPFSESEAAHFIFFKLFDLITDKKEFFNIYRDILGKRIFSRESSIQKELSIIKKLQLDQESSLTEMVRDMENGTKHIRILSSNNWNFSCENDDLNIPTDLFNLISNELTNFTKIYENKDKSKCKYSFTNNLGTECRQIKFAHQFSRLFIVINNRKLIISFYQYILLELLKKPYKIHEIYKKINLNERKIDFLLKNLITNKLVMCTNKIYHIAENEPYKNGSNQFADDMFTDISLVNLDAFYNQEFDESSHLLALLVKIIKQKKTMNKQNLANKLNSLCHKNVKTVLIDDLITSAEEKGVIEISNGLIHYSS
ncbi:hypothetical protein NUSPORA_00887 [Nucleospora cyclopteri]